MKKLFTLFLMVSLCAGLFGQAAVTRVWLKAGGTITFEGTTEDAFQTVLAVVDPTADRTVTFKDESGTVAYLSDICGMGDIGGCLTTGFFPIATAAKCIGDSAIDQDITTCGVVTITCKDLHVPDVIYSQIFAGTITCTTLTGNSYMKISNNNIMNLFVGDGCSISTEIMRLHRTQATRLFQDLSILGVACSDGRLSISQDCVCNNFDLRVGNLTGARDYEAPDESGSLMVDSCLTAGYIPVSSATAGVPVDSVIDQGITTCGTVTICCNHLALTGSRKIYSGHIQGTDADGDEAIAINSLLNKITITVDGNLNASFNATQLNLHQNTLLDDGKLLSFQSACCSHNTQLNGNAATATRVQGFADVCGVIMVDNCLGNNRLGMGTATPGEFVPAPLRFIGCDIRTDNGIDFEIANSCGFFGVLTAAQLDASYTYNFSNQSGRLATLGVQTVDLTADCQVVTPTASTTRLTSDCGTAANRTFTICSGSLVEGQTYTLVWVDACGAGELLDTCGIHISTCWVPNFTDSIQIHRDTSITFEVGRSPNN